MDFTKLNDSVSAVISIEDVFPLPRLRMRPSRTRNRDWLPSTSRVSSREMRLHRFQRLKVSIWPNRTHCAAASVDFLGYILLLRKYCSLRKKTIDSVLLPTFSANITNHDRKYATNNALSVYFVPFLRLSSVLIALNSLPTSYP